MFLQYQVMTMERHLEALYLLVDYLSKKLFERAAFDPNIPVMDESSFNLHSDQKEFYGNVEEEDPKNIPEPLGKLAVISYIESDHFKNCCC